MIEIVPLSPKNKLAAAEQLRYLIVSEWLDLEKSSRDDRIRMFVGLHLLFEVDVGVEISLAQARPVGACRIRSGESALASEVTSGLLAIEVKQQSRECFQIAGTEILPMYGRIASKALAMNDLVKRYVDLIL